jgi:hypothetical protein
MFGNYLKLVHGRILLCTSHPIRQLYIIWNFFLAVNPPQRGFIERGFYYKLLNNRVIIYQEKKVAER